MVLRLSVGKSLTSSFKGRSIVEELVCDSIALFILFDSNTFAQKYRICYKICSLTSKRYENHFKSFFTLLACKNLSPEGFSPFLIPAQYTETWMFLWSIGVIQTPLASREKRENRGTFSLFSSQPRWLGRELRRVQTENRLGKHTRGSQKNSKQTTQVCSFQRYRSCWVQPLKFKAPVSVKANKYSSCSTKKIVFWQRIGLLLLSRLLRFSQEVVIDKNTQNRLKFVQELFFNIYVIQMFNKFGLVEATRPQQANSNLTITNSQLEHKESQVNSSFLTFLTKDPNCSGINQQSSSISVINQEKSFFLDKKSYKPKVLRQLFALVGQQTLDGKLEQCFENIMSLRVGNSEWPEECLWVPQSQTLEEYILQELPLLNGQESRQFVQLLKQNRLIYRYLQYVYDTQRLLFMNDLILASYGILQELQPYIHLNHTRDQLQALSVTILPKVFSHPHIRHLKLHILPNFPNQPNQLTIIAPGAGCLIEAAQLFTQAIIVAATSAIPESFGSRKKAMKSKQVRRIRRVSTVGERLLRNNKNVRQ